VVLFLEAFAPLRGVDWARYDPCASMNACSSMDAVYVYTIDASYVKSSLCVLLNKFKLQCNLYYFFSIFMLRLDRLVRHELIGVVKLDSTVPMTIIKRAEVDL
jgi:hypothetical protein